MVIVLPFNPNYMVLSSTDTNIGVEGNQEKLIQPRHMDNRGIPGQATNEKLISVWSRFFACLFSVKSFQKMILKQEMPIKTIYGYYTCT